MSLLAASFLPNAIASDSQVVQPPAETQYLVVLEDGVVQPGVSETARANFIQSTAQELARSHGAKLVTTYSLSLAAFVVEAEPTTAKRLAKDDRVKNILRARNATEDGAAGDNMGGVLEDSGNQVQGGDCPYDYCGHMVVTGFVIKHLTDMSGFVPPGVPLLPREVAELPPFEDILLPFKDIPRSPNLGHEDVGCSNVEPVRQGEAANQLGPHLPSVGIGYVIRINYGNGQSELFVVVNRHSSLPAVPVPGTCG